MYGVNYATSPWHIQGKSQRVAIKQPRPPAIFPISAVKKNLDF